MPSRLKDAARHRGWREASLGGGRPEFWVMQDGGKDGGNVRVRVKSEEWEIAVKMQSKLKSVNCWRKTTRTCGGGFSQTSKMIFVKLIQSWTSAARFKKLISFCLFFFFTHLWTILFNHLENNKTIGVTLHYLVHKLVLVQEIDGKLPPGVTKCHRAFLDAVLDCVTWPRRLCEILSCNPDIQTSRHSAAVSSYLDFLNHSGIFVFCRRLPS